MAYNLQPLITTLKQILNPDQIHWILDHNKPQLEALLEKVASLQHILEKSPLTKIESLESQIRDATHKAEDIIESHMVDQMLLRRRRWSRKHPSRWIRMLSRLRVRRFTLSTQDLQQVTEELDSAIEQVMKLLEGKTTSSGCSSSCVSFSLDVHSAKLKAVVGVDADLMQLKDRLTGMQSKLEIVPIVGMGEIGKTTLARKIYEDDLIVSRFDYRGWTTISQEYNMRAILLSLLRCIVGNEHGQQIEKGNNELKDVLYKSLYGRRYLIVLDDMWSTHSWDEIRNYFPDNNNGSRILLTTRESDVAKHANSSSVQHQMQFLSESTSWDLLRQIVFGEEGCPDFLQGIGEKIARDCGGLPLAISVIGGLLSKVQRTSDVWNNISNNVASAIAESDEQFSQILSLSYNHLPNHLKPCFLYMGAFPEDYEIETSKLVLLWVAEGFVKSNGDKSLEEEAEDYLKALVERNLLSVRRYKRSYGKRIRCSIHDLLRDLCTRKAYKDKFLHVMNSPNVMREGDEDNFPQFSNPRRVSVYESYATEDGYASAAELMSTSLARSFLVLSTKSLRKIPSSFFSMLRLVRVLDVITMGFTWFPDEILRLVNLRFLAVSYRWGGIPREISRLWNLQTLIAITEELGNEVPLEIWELSELRHLYLRDLVILFRDEDVKQIVHRKLQTISVVQLTRSLIRNGFLEGIPNIKDLGISYDDDCFESGAIDLSHLHKLETLRCYSKHFPGPGVWPILKFPLPLRKLKLYEIAMLPRVSTLLCALPNLEVLKIERCVFGEEWEVAEGDEFRSLQYLSLADLRLKRWGANAANFPRLHHLRLRICDKLEEIPSDIGEIPTLQLIEVLWCSASVVASAKKIVEEQQSEYDNYDLKLVMTGPTASGGVMELYR